QRESLAGHRRIVSQHELRRTKTTTQTRTETQRGPSRPEPAPVRRAQDRHEHLLKEPPLARGDRRNGYGNDSETELEEALLRPGRQLGSQRARTAPTSRFRLTGFLSTSVPAGATMGAEVQKMTTTAASARSSCMSWYSSRPSMCGMTRSTIATVGGDASS